MIWSVDFYTSFVQYALLTGMIFIYGVIIPERVIVRVNSLNACLNDRVAAREARKFRYVNNRVLKGATTNACGVYDRIILGMADDPQLLGRIEERLLIIMYTTR